MHFNLLVDKNKTHINSPGFVSVPLSIRSIRIRLHLHHNFSQRSSFRGFFGLYKTYKHRSPVSSASVNIRKGSKCRKPLGVQLCLIGVDERTTRAVTIKANNPPLTTICKRQRNKLDGYKIIRAKKHEQRLNREN